MLTFAFPGSRFATRNPIICLQDNHDNFTVLGEAVDFPMREMQVSCHQDQEETCEKSSAPVSGLHPVVPQSETPRQDSRQADGSTHACCGHCHVQGYIEAWQIG